MTFTLLGQNKPTAVFSHVFEYGYLQLLQFQGETLVFYIYHLIKNTTILIWVDAPTIMLKKNKINNVSKQPINTWYLWVYWGYIYKKLSPFWPSDF